MMGKLDQYGLAASLANARLFGWVPGTPDVDFNFPITLFDARYELTGVVDPTNALDSSQGVIVGTTYTNTATLNQFLCISAALGAAVWRHVPRVLGASAAAASCGVDTTEDILATVTVPANAMGPKGILRIRQLWTMTNSANNKLLRSRLGGISGTAFFACTQTTIVTYSDQRDIANRALTNSQVAWNSGSTAGGWGSSGGAVQTGALDTTLAQDLVFTGQKATAGEALTLELFIVELLRPDIT